MQQVGVIAEQVIDQPGGACMAGQRAQQVPRGVLPPAQPAKRDERQRERPFVIGPWHDVRSCAQQCVVQCLVEQLVHRGAARAVA